MRPVFVEGQASLAAGQYIVERLLEGNALAQAALRHLQLSQGRVATYLPKGIVPESVRDFETGGKLPTPPTSDWTSTEVNDETLLMIPVPNTDDWLVSKIEEYLARDEGRVCVFEDALSREGDPILRRRGTKHAVLNKEIYHFLFHEDASEKKRIQATINAAKSIPTFIGLLSKWSGLVLGGNHVSLSAAQLEDVALNAETLIVGAYDGEGYLVWTSGKSIGARPR